MKKTIRENYRVEVRPDLRGWVMPRDEGEHHKVVLSLLRDLREQVGRHVDDIDSAVVTWDTRYECSHCGAEWEALTAAQAAWTNRRYLYGEHSIVGEPGCCDPAINEFRTERGIPLLEDS